MPSSFSRPRRSQNRLTRLVAFSVTFIALLLLCASVFYLNQFRQQRVDAQRNQLILSAWQEQLLTATPAAVSRDLLQDELRGVQQRFAQASGLLPGVNLELAVLQRIQEAVELSGVELTSLQQKGTPFHEGALVGSHYAISVAGDLERVTDFAIRLEEEAFPAAYFAEDAILNASKDDQYVFAATLTVYGSTLSTGSLTDERLLKQPVEAAEFRERAQQALRLADYELALSLLLQYAALEPESAEVDSLLYESYVQYGNDMLAQGHNELAKQQCEAAQTLNPNGSEALACLVALGQQPTVTTDGLAMNDQTATALNGSSDGSSDGNLDVTATATTTTGTPDPLVSTPTVDPLVSTPTVDPLVSTPTVDPLVSTPTVDPLVSTPTVDPLVSTPTVDPLVSTPTVDPLVSTPTADPLVNTSTPNPSAEPTPTANTATPTTENSDSGGNGDTGNGGNNTEPSQPNTPIPTIQAPQTRTPGIPATPVPPVPTATITKISATVTPVSSDEPKGPSLPPTIDNPSPTGTPTNGSSEPPSLPNTPVSSNTPIPDNAPTERPGNTAPTEAAPSHTPTTGVAPTVVPTVTPSHTPTTGVAPTVVPTVTPSHTPTTGVAPTVGPTVTTLSATATATVTLTATETNDPTATATAQASPTSGLAFAANAPFYLPNCGLTHIKGTIRQQGSNTPIRGITVRVWFDGAAVDEIYSNPSDTNGEWDVVLADYAKAGTWFIQVIDRATRVGLSERQTVFTDTGPCQPGESGHQVVIQDFFYQAGPGTPIPTAGPTNTATMTPTPTVTPTPTTTPTPTVIPSPTGTPVPLVFAEDEIPDLFIPDGPNGQTTSTITVQNDIILRQMRIHLNINDNENAIEDLDIDLIHPDGTSIRLHSEGEGALARWISITGGDLASLEGKSAQGNWTLKLVDRFEGKTCRLASWQIEIYP